MKKAVLTGLFLSAATVAFAHPASDVKINFDKDTKMLSVKAEHQVRDAAVHYIDDLVIRVNNKPIAKIAYSMQSSLDGQFVTVKDEAIKSADTIDVYTECNKGGVKNATYLVP